MLKVLDHDGLYSSVLLALLPCQQYELVAAHRVVHEPVITEVDATRCAAVTAALRY